MESMGLKKIIVTGSDGYIGSVLADSLLERGFEVFGIDTLFFNPSFSVLQKNNSHFLKRDVRDLKYDDIFGFDAIIHLAGLSNDPLGEIDSKLTSDINFQATIKLAKLAKKARIKRFIFSSSCSVYGIEKNGIVDESSKVNPLTTYAKSKIMAEKELVKLADGKFCVGILRNSTVCGYSPNLRIDLVVNNLVLSAVVLKEIRIMSDGEPWRPLIDIRDLSRIFIEFLKIDRKLVNGEIINVGFKENNFQVKDIVSEIQKQIPECKVKYTGEHGSDSRSYCVNFNKFNKLFPHVNREWSLERSIKDLISQLKSKRFSKDDFYSGRYVRISAIRNLLSVGYLNEKLYWNKNYFKI